MTLVQPPASTENAHEASGATGAKEAHSLNSNRIRPDQDEISLRVPALRRYVASVRSLTTALAAQAELTVDEIEDVQMAIDEACALLLQQVTRSRTWLDLHFWISDGRFDAEVQIAVPASVELDRSSLSWMVLSALTEDLELAADGQSLCLRFCKRRGSIAP